MFKRAASWLGRRSGAPGTGLPRSLSALMLLVLLAGCYEDPAPPAGPQYLATPPADQAPAYRLAVHLGHNPLKIARSYQPLVDHLNRRSGEARFELESARNLAAFEARFRAREPDALIANPWQALQAMKAGYSVIAMAGDAAEFRGLILVRRDSNIAAPGELKGRTVAYPAPTALAACIQPQWFLHENGIDVGRDINSRYVGSQESAIMAVYLGEAAAGGTWPPPWRAFQKEHPDEAAQLRVAWETQPLLNNAVMVRDDLPRSVRDRMKEQLFALNRSEAGRRIMAGIEADRFRPANDASYAPVQAFVARFEAQVRAVEAAP